MSLRSVPKIAFCRYFGTMTMWYRQYHRTWLWLCHSRIVVSPSCGLGGSTPGETTSLFTNQRRNGRACSSLTARGGGLPVGGTGIIEGKSSNPLRLNSPCQGRHKAGARNGHTTPIRPTPYPLHP